MTYIKRRIQPEAHYTKPEPKAFHIQLTNPQITYIKSITPNIKHPTEGVSPDTPKSCTSCRRYLTISHFGTNSVRADGLAAVCFDCRKEKPDKDKAPSMNGLVPGVKLNIYHNNIWVLHYQYQLAKHSPVKTSSFFIYSIPDQKIRNVILSIGEDLIKVEIDRWHSFVCELDGFTELNLEISKLAKSRDLRFQSKMEDILLLEDRFYVKDPSAS